MKTRVVQTIEADGHSYGQVSSPDDLRKAQDFAHGHVLDVTHDFVNSELDAIVAGFDYTLGSGNSRTITIVRPGRIYTPASSFELLADTVLNVAASDADNSRIDIIVGVLEDEVPAELDLIPFVQLRTADEFTDAVPPYPPANLSQPTQTNWRVTPQIKTGTPAVTPAAPALESNEVLLYVVTVPAGSLGVHDVDIADERVMIRSLQRQNELLDAQATAIAGLQNASEFGDIGSHYLNPPVQNHDTTLLEILSDLYAKISPSRDLPEIRYDHPKVALTDPASSQIVATGNVVSSQPVVEIPSGGRVNFGDAEVTILPQNFADQSVNPRFATIPGVSAVHELRNVAITLGGVTVGASDGSSALLPVAAVLNPSRSFAASAARDDRYTEIFGGISGVDGSRLSDWKTYDSLNDTSTSRTLTGTAIPAADRPLMIPYGDGTHVLVLSNVEVPLTDNGRTFKVNASTAVSTEITTTHPQGVKFIGDLIGNGKAFLVALKADATLTYWEFDTATDTFTQLTVTGSIPNWAGILNADGCMYRENQFVLFNSPDGINDGGTFVFDRTTLQWTQLNIPMPFTPGSTQQNSSFSMSNVNGRPTLLGGYYSDGNIWELRGPTGTGFQNAGISWVATPTSLPLLIGPSTCSLLGADSRPTSSMFIFGGGTDRFAHASSVIYGSRTAGLIAVTYNSVTGVSIAPSSTYVQFELPSYTGSGGAVLAYLASLVGQYTPSNVLVEASFDDGGNWHVITPDRTFTVTDSTAPVILRRRITLYNSKTNPPILTGLTEALDQSGNQIEDRRIIRFDVPAGGAQALYITPDGVVTISATIEPSTPGKAIILKFTPNGSSAPTLKNYINRRRPHIQYTGLKGSGSFNFDNELAVPVRFVRGYAIKVADSHLYNWPATGPTFDQTIIYSAGIGITTGDTWVVELEG